MSAQTAELIKLWKREVVEAPPSQRADRAQNFRQRMHEAGRRRGGFYDVAKEIDFAQLFEECAPAEVNDFLASNKPLTRDSSALWESSLGVLTSNHFQDLLGPIISVGMWQGCDMAPFGISAIVPTIPAGCRQTDFYGFGDLGDVVEENENELEETEYKGVPAPRKITQPIRRKKKFAFGITREALCRDVEDMFRGIMRQGAQSLSLHKEKLLVDTVFELFPVTGFYRPYIENDTRYHTYYTTGGPWVNRLIDNSLDGTYLPFDVLEQHAEDLTDPFTGEPVVCMFKDILVTNGNAADKAQQGLGVMQVMFDLADPSLATLDPRAEVTRPANTRFGRIVSSQYIMPRLRTWYVNVAGLDAADAALAARATWVAGDFAKAFGWAEEWPTETLERAGTDTEEYFSQEIVWQIKYLQKADPIVRDPRAVIINVPDLTDYASYAVTDFDWL